MKTLQQATLALGILLGPLCNSATAQDYMEDLRGEGNPISTSGGKGDVYVRLNTSDESMKFGLLHTYHMKINLADTALKVTKLKKPDRACKTALQKYHKATMLGEAHGEQDLSTCVGASVTNAIYKDLGWGLYIKGKPSDGLATVFSEGEFNTGTRVSGYLLYKRTVIQKDYFAHAFWIVPSVAWQQDAFGLAHTANNGTYQFADTSLGSWDIGLSAVYKVYLGKEKNKPANSQLFRRNELFIGLSVTQAQPNNYGDLTKVELAQSTSRTDTVNGQPVVTTTEVKGQSSYGVGSLRQVSETRIRMNAAIIPEALDHRFAFNLFPSLNFREEQDMRFDVGFSVNVLAKGDRALAIGGFSMEMADVTNIAASNGPFLKRSFRFGLNAGLNIDGLFAKK